MGIATVNQAGSIGAIGATMMAGYRLHQGKKNAYYPIIIAIVSIIPIYFLSKNYNLNVKAIDTRDLGAILIASANERLGSKLGYNLSYLVTI